MSDDLKPFVERSASTDLPFLLSTKEGAKKRMKENPTKDNIDAFRKVRDEVNKAASEGESVAAGRLFAKRDEALAYLKARGFKISRAKFQADCKQGLVPTNQSGQFEESVLLAYAAQLPTVARDEDVGVSNAMRERLIAETELKQINAKRTQLRLDQELGKLMPRDAHERDLAVRAQLFRNEIEGRDRRLAPKLVELIVTRLAELEGLSKEAATMLRDAAPSLVPDITHFLQHNSEVLMDAWSADREFVVENDEMLSVQAESGE